MSEMDDSFALPKGTDVAGFMILETLGTGSFGITYKAFDPVTERTVALKEYMPGQYARRRRDLRVVPVSAKKERFFREGLERFEREAKILANLGKHPNIVLVYSALTDIFGTAYIVMEYVAGEELEDRIDRRGPMNQSSFWELAKQILSGADFVHHNGLLHRDLKPSNIIIDENDQAILIDFGAARQTAVSNKTLIVTDGYSPPEQYQKGQDQGPYSDIYALAATAFFVLSGETVPDVRVRSSIDDVPDLVAVTDGRISRELSDVIAWGLELDAKDRPQSIEEWRVRLAEAIEPPIGIPEPEGPDRRLVLGLFAGGVVAAAGGAAYFLGSGGTVSSPEISGEERNLVAGDMRILGLVREDPFARARIIDGKPVVAAHTGETIGQNGGMLALTDPKITVAQMNWNGTEANAYNGMPFKYAQAMTALPDGGMVIGGTRSNDFGFSSKVSYLLRLDRMLTPIWEKSFGAGSITDLVVKNDLIHFALEGVNVDGKAALIRTDLSGDQVGAPIELGTRRGDSVQRLVVGPDGTLGAAILRFKEDGFNRSILMQLAVNEATGEATEYFVESDGLWLDERGLKSSHPYALARIGNDFLVSGTVAYGVNDNGLFGRQPYIGRYSGDRRAPGDLKWRVVHNATAGSRDDFGEGRALATYQDGDELPRVYSGQFLFGEGQSRVCQIDDAGEILATTTIGSPDQPFLINDLALGSEGGIAIGMTQGQNSGALAAVPLTWA